MVRWRVAGAFLVVLLAVATGATAQDAAVAPEIPELLPPIADPGGDLLFDEGGTVNFPFVDLTVRDATSSDEVVLSLQLLLLLSVLTLAPSFVILMTAFLRIALVLDFVKRALSLQQVPPNQVLMGVALFLTLFVMWPTFDQVYQQGIAPFAAGEIDTETLYTRSEGPVRDFMFRQVGDDTDNIRLFMSMRGLDKPETRADVPTYVLIPAFILNELTVAFKIGILIYVPFIIIDMVVATTLISMGIIVLPPVLISLPFKLILFVLVDGWGLITMEVMRSFQ